MLTREDWRELHRMFPLLFTERAAKDTPKIEAFVERCLSEELMRVYVLEWAQAHRCSPAMFGYVRNTKDRNEMAPFRAATRLCLEHDLSPGELLELARGFTSRLVRYPTLGHLQGRRLAQEAMSRLKPGEVPEQLRDAETAKIPVVSEIPRNQLYRPEPPYMNLRRNWPGLYDPPVPA